MFNISNSNIILPESHGHNGLEGTFYKVLFFVPESLKRFYSQNMYVA